MRGVGIHIEHVLHVAVIVLEIGELELLVEKVLLVRAILLVDRVEDARDQAAETGERLLLVVLW